MKKIIPLTAPILFLAFGFFLIGQSLAKESYGPMGGC